MHDAINVMHLRLPALRLDRNNTPFINRWAMPGLSHAQKFEHYLYVFSFSVRRARRQWIFGHWIEFVGAFWLPLYTCTGEQQKKANGKSTKCVHCSRASTIRWVSVWYVRSLAHTVRIYSLVISSEINSSQHCLFIIVEWGIRRSLSVVRQRKQPPDISIHFCEQKKQYFFLSVAKGCVVSRFRHRLWLP